MEAVLQTGTDQAIGPGDRGVLLDKKRKRIGNYMLKPGKIKGGRVEEKIKIDSQKGDNIRVPVEIWDRRAWNYEGDRENGVLNIVWESMLRWCRRKLTREFPQDLRRSSYKLKQVGSCPGIRELAGEYVCIE